MQLNLSYFICFPDAFRIWNDKMNKTHLLSLNHAARADLKGGAPPPPPPPPNLFFTKYDFLLQYLIT